MIAIMVAIVVIMSRVFSSIYVGFYGLLSAKLIVILHLAKTFSQKKSPKLLRISILLHNFAIATILMRNTPHRQRARIYVQARPTFLIGYGLIFLPVTCRICTGVYALCLCGALRIMWRCKLKIYGGSPSTCFFSPLRRISMSVVADEEVRAAFFVPLRQTVPGGSRDKATTLKSCKRLHYLCARLKGACWASERSRLRPRPGSGQRARV